MKALKGLLILCGVLAELVLGLSGLVTLSGVGFWLAAISMFYGVLGAIAIGRELMAVIYATEFRVMVEDERRRANLYEYGPADRRVLEFVSEPRERLREAGFALLLDALILLAVSLIALSAIGLSMKAQVEQQNEQKVIHALQGMVAEQRLYYGSTTGAGTYLPSIANMSSWGACNIAVDPQGCVGQSFSNPEFGYDFTVTNVPTGGTTGGTSFLITAVPVSGLGRLVYCVEDLDGFVHRQYASVQGLTAPSYDTCKGWALESPPITGPVSPSVNSYTFSAGPSTAALSQTWAAFTTVPTGLYVVSGVVSFSFPGSTKAVATCTPSGGTAVTQTSGMNSNYPPNGSLAILAKYQITNGTGLQVACTAAGTSISWSAELTAIQVTN